MRDRRSPKSNGDVPLIDGVRCARSDRNSKCRGVGLSHLILRNRLADGGARTGIGWPSRMDLVGGCGLAQITRVNDARVSKTQRTGLPPHHLKARRILVPMNNTYAARMAHGRMMSTVGIRRTSEWFQMSPKGILKTRMSPTSSSPSRQDCPPAGRTSVVLPPDVAYGRPTTCHPPDSSLNRSPTWGCIGKIRVVPACSGGVSQGVAAGRAWPFGAS